MYGLDRRTVGKVFAGAALAGAATGAYIAARAEHSLRDADGLFVPGDTDLSPEGNALVSIMGPALSAINLLPEGVQAPIYNALAAKASIDSSADIAYAPQFDPSATNGDRASRIAAVAAAATVGATMVMGVPGLGLGFIGAVVLPTAVFGTVKSQLQVSDARFDYEATGNSLAVRLAQYATYLCENLGMAYGQYVALPDAAFGVDAIADDFSKGLVAASSAAQVTVGSYSTKAISYYEAITPYINSGLDKIGAVIVSAGDKADQLADLAYRPLKIVLSDACKKLRQTLTEDIGPGAARQISQFITWYVDRFNKLPEYATVVENAWEFYDRAMSVFDSKSELEKAWLWLNGVPTTLNEKVRGAADRLSDYWWENFEKPPEPLPSRSMEHEHTSWGDDPQELPEFEREQMYREAQAEYDRTRQKQDVGLQSVTEEEYEEALDEAYSRPPPEEEAPQPAEGTLPGAGQTEEDEEPPLYERPSVVVQF